MLHCSYYNELMKIVLLQNHFSKVVITGILLKTCSKNIARSTETCVPESLSNQAANLHI